MDKTCFCLSEAMYMSQELWEEMLSEKNKQLLKLTNKYAARMKRQQVHNIHNIEFYSLFLVEFRHLYPTIQ